MRCKNCLLPATVPGAGIDQAGLCSLCRDPVGRSAATQKELKQKTGFAVDLERTLADVRGTGESYDVLVCMSGGKDSLALLYKLKVEYRLSVLAWTTDISIPEVAWRSIRKTIKQLGVDHLVYRPPEWFYRKLFRYLLANQEERGAVYTVSHVYAPLFEGDALTIAMEKRIPLIAAGYSPGQPEPERMVYEFSRDLIEHTDWTPPALRTAGLIDGVEASRFWNPHRYPAGTRFPRYIAPFHAWDYDQEQTMRDVVRWGLVEKAAHASPILSNYPINWLLMYSDLLNFGYNPYAPEFADLIRCGKANRTHWRLLAPLVDLMIRRRFYLGAQVTAHLRWLGLTPADLKVTLPRGAYDPPR